MSSAIIAGLSLAALGYSGRYIIRSAPTVATKFNAILKDFPPITAESLLGSKYYKGGFEPTMSRREAERILGVSSTASKKSIKQAHNKIMGLNHPDRGGSPYLAIKINEAKDFLDKIK